MVLLRTVATLLLLALAARSQSIQHDIEKLPPELQVSDNEARTLWIEALTHVKNGDYSAGEMSLGKAIDICTEKKYQADCGVLKATLAQWEFFQGHLEVAAKLYQDAYDAALRSENQLLQADLLINQAISQRVDNNLEESKAQLNRALELAKKSKHKGVLARAYAEQASFFQWARQPKAAEDAIDIALAIDDANGYDKSLHYLYKAQILRSDKKRSVEASRILLEARTYSKEKENAYVFAFTTIELAEV